MSALGGPTGSVRLSAAQRTYLPRADHLPDDLRDVIYAGSAVTSGSGAESIIGLCKAECTHCEGPWHAVEELELATLIWVDGCCFLQRVRDISRKMPRRIRALLQDAVREDLVTGQPIAGKWHFQKAEDTARGLGKWLRRNQGADPHDRIVAQGLHDDLVDALGRKP